MLFRLLDTAECPARRVAGLVSAHAARDELVFEQPQVRAHFAGEIGLGP